ncbi:MAG TPA: hypothetical protein VFW96_06065 [Thermomicrobiales bacterium]|nr:hypothetical protein [Thermomicrobiales bacterium]
MNHRLHLRKHDGGRKITKQESIEVVRPDENRGYQPSGKPVNWVAVKPPAAGSAMKPPKK